ncbi:MAG: glutamate--tRNA ligase [Anaerohalosphaeraceae bacterium]|nr:glutamate--tRNA ligase [Anaerohalosphaeraceae bacterium]
MAVTRFAPSPTGYLHIGGARTALFDLLWARKTGGKFILRIEDTDQSRNSPTAAEQVMNDLKWLGINWDAGPFYQSQRREIYDKYIAQLLNDGKAYYCFDTPDELGAIRAECERAKKNFIYARPENFPAEADVEAARAQGRPVVVRFCMPTGEIVVEDTIRGQVKFDCANLSDFIIQKNDGFPTYHLACVIDDELMGIDCVIRGQEHLMNTPLHIALQNALGFKRPAYAHISVTVSEGGGKMSKRDRAKVLKAAIKANPEIDLEKLIEVGGLTNDKLKRFLKGKEVPDNPQVDAMAKFLGIELPEINIVDFLKSGYLPETLVNFIALLGYSPGGDKEIMTLDEIIESFDPSRFNKTNSLFDRKKLLSFNTEHIKMLDAETLLGRYKDYLAVADSPAKGADDALLGRIVKSCDGARTLAEIDKKSRFLFCDNEEIEYDEKSVKKVLLKNDGEGLAMLALLKAGLNQLAEVTNESVEKMLRDLAEEKQLGLGKIAQPLRVAICGSTVSIPIFEAIDLLGLEKTIERIEAAIKKFSS